MGLNATSIWDSLRNILTKRCIKKDDEPLDFWLHILVKIFRNKFKIQILVAFSPIGLNDMGFSVKY